MSFSPALNIGMTRAIFNCFGTMPEVMFKLIMQVRGKIIISIDSLIKFIEMFHNLQQYLNDKYYIVQ